MFQLTISRKTIQKALTVKHDWKLPWVWDSTKTYSFYMQAACSHAQLSSLCLRVARGLIGTFNTEVFSHHSSVSCVLTAISFGQFGTEEPPFPLDPMSWDSWDFYSARVFVNVMWNRRATFSLGSHLLRLMRLWQHEGICKCCDVFMLRVAEHLILGSSSAIASPTQDINDCNISARDLQCCRPPWLQESSQCCSHTAL